MTDIRPVPTGGLRSNRDVMAGLTSFFDRAAALRQASPDQQLERLKSVLGDIIGSAQRGLGPRTTLSADRLRAVLDAVGGPLADARRRGAFVNVWAVAGLGRSEVRTAAVLAWLLDPSGSHGGGDAYAQALWRSAHDETPGFNLSGLRRASPEVTPLGDGSDRVDIVLEGDDFLVFIEVKIDAGQQPGQLTRYAAAAARTAALRGKPHHAVIYLCERAENLPAACRRITWRSVGSALRSAERSLARRGAASDATLQFAAHVEHLH